MVFHSIKMRRLKSPIERTVDHVFTARSGAKIQVVGRRAHASQVTVDKINHSPLVQTSETFQPYSRR